MMFCVSQGSRRADRLAAVRHGASCIREARRLKILFGGAWRQAGIMAAAGLVALRDRAEARCIEDHERARRLAEGDRRAPARHRRSRQVETNMVFVDTEAVGLDAARRARAAARTWAWERRSCPARSAWSRTSTSTTTDSRSRWTRGERSPRTTPRRRRRWACSRRTIRRRSPARIPPGQRLVKTWPVLHYGPIPKFDGTNWDLEVSGLVEHPFTLIVRGAAGAAARDGRRRHALRHRVDDARQHLGGRLVHDAPRDGRADGRGEVGDRALRARLHVEPVARRRWPTTTCWWRGATTART